MEPKKTEYEICACCGKVTKVKKSTPIEFRDNYIEGAGQLCVQCVKELYSENKESNY